MIRTFLIVSGEGKWPGLISLPESNCEAVGSFYVQGPFSSG